MKFQFQHLVLLSSSIISKISSELIPSNTVPTSISDLLFINTLDGALHAIDAKTGSNLWTNSEHLSLSINGLPEADKTTFNRDGIIIPCPKNGEIYIMDKQNSVDYELIKTPWTVPKLVERCPITTQTAIFQGQKRDTWIEIDGYTGEEILRTSDGMEALPNPPKCEDGDRKKSAGSTIGKNGHDFDENYENVIHDHSDHDNSIDHNSNENPRFSVGFPARHNKNRITLAKSDFILTKRSRFDIEGGTMGEIVWNITYSKFQVNEQIPEKYNYEHYFADNRILTVDKKTGKTLWKKSVSAQIVNMFTWDRKFASMFQVPEHHLAIQTYQHILSGKVSDVINVDGSRVINGVLLKPSLRLKSCDDTGGNICGETIWTDPHIERLSAKTELVRKNHHHQGFYKREEGDYESDDGSGGVEKVDGALEVVKSDLVQAKFYYKHFDRLELEGFYETPEYPERCECDINHGCHDVTSYKKCIPDKSDYFEFNKYTIYKSRIKKQHADERKKSKEKRLKEIRDDRIDKIKITKKDNLKLSFLKKVLIFAKNFDVHDLLLALFTVIIGLLVIGIVAFSRNLTKPQEEKKELGRMECFTSKSLGQGCLGTEVYEGTFDKRPCAIKRVLLNQIHLAEKEIDLLRKNDYHNNVVRYYDSERDNDFLYIALELCECTLKDYIEKNLYDRWRAEIFRAEKSSFSPFSNKTMNQTGRLEILDALYQSTDGLSFLHSSGVIHRDVKPSNILIAKSRDGSRRIVLSDFGLSKQIDALHTSFSIQSQTGMVGTNGWMAPEMVENYFKMFEDSKHRKYSGEDGELQESQEIAAMDKKMRISRQVDIFSLGCVFYWCLTKEHPFGDLNPLVRQNRIIRGEHCVDKLITVKETGRKGGFLNTEGDWVEEQKVKSDEKNEDSDAKVTENTEKPEKPEKPEKTENNTKTSERWPNDGPVKIYSNVKAKSISSAHCHEAHHLITQMLKKEPMERPPAQACRNHPFFWTKEKHLKFLVEVSNVLEPYNMDYKNNHCDEVVYDLESRSDKIFRSSGWGFMLSPKLQEKLHCRRKYNYYSVRDLLRVIRNKHQHWSEMGDDEKNMFMESSSKVSRAVNEMDTKYYKFWTVKFPPLLIQTWLSMGRWYQKCGSLDNYYGYKGTEFLFCPVDDDDDPKANVGMPDKLRTEYERYAEKIKLRENKARNSNNYSSNGYTSMHQNRSYNSSNYNNSNFQSSGDSPTKTQRFVPRVKTDGKPAETWRRSGSNENKRKDSYSSNNANSNDASDNEQISTQNSTNINEQNYSKVRDQSPLAIPKHLQNTNSTKSSSHKSSSSPMAGALWPGATFAQIMNKNDQVENEDVELKNIQATNGTTENNGKTKKKRVRKPKKKKDDSVEQTPEMGGEGVVGEEEAVSFEEQSPEQPSPELKNLSEMKEKSTSIQNKSDEDIENHTIDKQNSETKTPTKKHRRKRKSKTNKQADGEGNETKPADSPVIEMPIPFHDPAVLGFK